MTIAPEEALHDLPHGQFPADNPPDAAARQRALDPARSFAVAAPAGSGKTGLLTQRVLTLLAGCEQPEEVLAITFTRKAAGEMQERIMEALREASETPEPSDPHKRRTWRLASAVLKRDAECHWQLLMSPQRLRIQTIDSLCRAITKQLPLESQLGAQPDTLDNPSLAYRQAVHNLFALLESDGQISRDLQHLLRHLDTNMSAAEKLLVSLLAKRDQWLGVMLEAGQQHAREYLEAVLEQVIHEHLDTLAESIGHHASDLCLLADKAAANVLEENPESDIRGLHGITDLPEPGPDGLPLWCALANLMLTAGGDWRKRLTKNEGFPAGKAHAPLKEAYAHLVAILQEDGPEDLTQQLHAVRQLPPPTYTDDQWQLLDCLTRILPHLAAQLTLVFKQLGATDYSAIAQAATAALGDEDNPSDIALKLDYRIQHILVDEFQDTAAPQLRLLELLTAGWQPGDGRTLFIVGDGMQSCYGFRDANVGLFLDARQHGIGEVALEALDLTVNFRSQANVVRWVNDVFHGAFPSRDDIGRGAVRYSPSVAFNQPLDDDAVRCYACLHQSEDAEEDAAHPDASPDRTLAQLREAESVAQLAEQALEEDPNGSVAILVRGRNHLAHVLPALARRQLFWQATDIDPLSSRMAIVDAMSLTRALLNPDDRIAWLSILRAPWCGLDLHDLHTLVTFDLGDVSPRCQRGWPVIWQQLQHWQAIEGLSDAGQACLQRLMAVLTQAWGERARKPLRQWLEGVWLALGGPALLTDASDRANMPSYFNLLERHQLGGGLRDWDNFQRAVESLFAAPRSDADPRLQVMTLHKSKGLEFDTVIIPGLDRVGMSDDSELLLWQQRVSAGGERQLLLGPLAPTGQDKDALYGFMRNEAKLRNAYEATRLLYVGCTRAVKRLHLIGCLGVDAKKGTIKAPVPASLMRTIWDQIEDRILPPPAENPTPVIESVDDDQRPGLQHLLRLPPHWRAPSPESVDTLADYRGKEHDDDEENIPEPEPRANRLARHTGTVLHGQLQLFTEKGITEWQPDWAEKQRDFWALQLRQHGWEGEELNKGLDKIAAGLELTLADEQGRWLLDGNHQDSQCELVIHHRIGKDVRESIIDRTFIADGVRWIIDYKSSRPEEGQDRAQFLAQEIAEYQPQLSRYAKVFQALEALPIKTALYFPLLEGDERLVEVAVADL
ncbi:UvrD-helicase domain-containing protein [Marinimicrobium alkaliphilum]|uniref:UvrD-helicase domain-containing protein n=1 Tax=Marinimicrobium alkaliphilum TaxID=2202654 RepID=UPI000DB92806|nr:UvrD-helicase domain-containing protein [Marinimicrobium alkaliphilum]